MKKYKIISILTVVGALTSCADNIHQRQVITANMFDDNYHEHYQTHQHVNMDNTIKEAKLTKTAAFEQWLWWNPLQSDEAYIYQVNQLEHLNKNQTNDYEWDKTKSLVNRLLGNNITVSKS